MQLHQLQPKYPSQGKKRVGRGGKKGTYSGRGGKGQSARSGRKMVPIIRELIKRYPKLKGYRTFRVEDTAAIVNLGILEKKVKDGDIITPKTLVEKGLVRQVKSKIPAIKILGTGKITKKLSFEGVAFSKSAKVAIEKAGGSIK